MNNWNNRKNKKAKKEITESSFADATESAWDGSEDTGVSSSVTLTGMDTTLSKSKSEKAKTVSKVPILGNLSKKTQKMIAYLGIGLSGAALLGNILLSGNETKSDYRIKGAMDENIALLKFTKNNITNAMLGKKDSLDSLQPTSLKIDENFSLLNNSLSKSVVESIKINWNSIRSEVNDILANRDNFESISINGDVILQNADLFATQSTQIKNQMLKDGVNSREMAIMADVISAFERIGKNVNLIQLYDKNKNIKPATDLWNDSSKITNNLNLLLSSPSLSNNVKLQLQKLSNDFKPMGNMMLNYVRNIANTNKIGVATDKLNLTLSDLEKTLMAISSNYQVSQSNGGVSTLNLTLLILLIGFIGLLSLIYSRSEKELEEEYKISGEDLKSSTDRLKRELKLIAASDLSNKINLNDDDKLLELKQDLNNFLISITDSLLNIKEELLQVTKSDNKSKERISNLQKVLKGMNNHLFNDNNDVQKIKTLNSDINENIVFTVNNTKSTLRYISNINEKVEKSQKSVFSMKNELDNAGERTERLIESSSKIVNLVSDLNELSEKMTMIGITSGLQAAKYGGQSGSGFHLIASEIKELAALTMTAVKKIGALTDTTNTDVISTNKSISLMKEQNEENGFTLDVISSESNNIKSNITGGVETNKNIVDAFKMQEELMNNIVENISILSEGIASINSDVKNIEDNLETSNQHVTQAKRSVEIYKLEK